MHKKGLAGESEFLRILENAKENGRTALFEDWILLMLRIYLAKERILKKGDGSAEGQN